MRRKLTLIILVASAFVGAGCSQLGPLYYKPSQEFSFHPPAKWRYNLPAEEIAVFQSHHVRGYIFRPNLNIIAEETNLVLEEYAEKQRRQYLPKLPGFSIVKEGYERYGEVWRITYDHHNRRYKTPIRSLLQLVLRGRTLYAITFSAPEPIWRRYEAMFLDSLETFRFGEEAKPIGYKENPYTKARLPAGRQ